MVKCGIKIHSRMLFAMAWIFQNKNEALSLLRLTKKICLAQYFNFPPPTTDAEKDPQRRRSEIGQENFPFLFRQGSMWSLTIIMPFTQKEKER